jgi:hypothetical protein
VINANWFRDPVDLNILPDYTTKVPKKDMRDLGTIKTKLGQGGYESPLETTLHNQTDRCRRKNWLVHELTKLRSYDDTTNEL